MLMPLAHSYFSLKAEYCDLENVFKSTATFDHFYDLMLTYFFFNVKILSKENWLSMSVHAFQIHQIQSLAKPFVFAKLAEKSP